MGAGGTDVIRARSTRMLFVAAALGSSALNAAFTVSPLITVAMTGSRAWSGIPGAASIAGTGLGALALTRIMAAYGRGRGLVFGYVVGVAGALAAVVATNVRSIALLIIGMVLMGAGHAGTQLARFAAAELHPVSARPRVLGWVVWASTVGAILGPLLPEPLERIARIFGAPGDASGYFVAILFFVASLVVSLMLRPDPSTLAIEDEGDRREEVASFRSMARLPHVRLALIGMLGSQAAMVLVMTVTPLHVREAGHGIGTIGYVMSAHLIGMFSLAPLAGRLVARWGSKAVMTGGLVILASAAVGSGLTTAEHGPVVAMWLFLLGLGWSLTFVAGSALLTTGLAYRSRVRLQGNVDAFTWTVAAVASASSGLTFARAGFDVLSFSGMVVALAPIAFILAVSRKVGASHPG